MKMNNFVPCVLISFLAVRSLYVVKGCFTIYHGPFYFLIEPQGLDINCTVVEFISCEGCAWHSLYQCYIQIYLCIIAVNLSTTMKLDCVFLSC